MIDEIFLLWIEPYLEGGSHGASVLGACHWKVTHLRPYTHLVPLATDMPPIPIVYDEEVTQLLESTQRRQKDITDFQIPRLRTCNGPMVLQQRLFAELREDIDLYARELQVSPIPLLHWIYCSYFLIGRAWSCLSRISEARNLVGTYKRLYLTARKYLRGHSYL